MKQIIVFIALLIFSSLAYADCRYNGKTYVQGTVINGYVCQPDGTWGD